MDENIFEVDYDEKNTNKLGEGEKKYIKFISIIFIILYIVSIFNHFGIFTQQEKDLNINNYKDFITVSYSETQSEYIAKITTSKKIKNFNITIKCLNVSPVNGSQKKLLETLSEEEFLEIETLTLIFTLDKSFSVPSGNIIEISGEIVYE